MSPNEKQGDGGCVTVEYSTEEKEELYDVDGDEDTEGSWGKDDPLLAYIYSKMTEE